VLEPAWHTLDFRAEAARRARCFNMTDATGRGSLAGTLEAALADFEPDSGSETAVAVQQAIHLARRLQERAAALQTPHERSQQAEFDRLMQSPHDKATLVELTDQAFRSASAVRSADQLTHILDVQGVPRFFSGVDRTLLKGFQSFGSYLPGVAVPLVKDKMREETANVILPAEEDLLTPHLNARRESGVRMNVNFLGEALLGEGEAEARLESYLEALQLPELEVLSVKISTIYSQISALAREDTIAVLCDRLELLYRASAKMRFTRADGSAVPKFVYLDMEEYGDVEVTAETFMQTLDRKGLERVSAGIALQAYLPDSFPVQRRIDEWARSRVAAGGAPITIRLVKGANLEMERVEASLRGWPQAPFRSKTEVDANYKRMLHEGMRPENLAAVRLGIASHNLFDLAYALALAAERGALDRIQFEMLEGMANHQRRALFELTENVLLYAPATRKEEFIHAIGYLIRRLDENTGADNFLRHAFRLRVDSDDWLALEAQFRASFALIDGLRERPRRLQDRREPVPDPPAEEPETPDFANEPDTDFALPQNVDWARTIVERWQTRTGAAAVEIPLCVGGEEIFAGRAVCECRDPSRPGVVVGRYRRATEADLLQAIACARSDAGGWRRASPAERSAILARAAREIRRSRADLIGAAMADGGKTLLESDPEVSEAVDFVEFYRRSASALHELPGVRPRGRGVVAVVAPWNFPIAIPCGGVAAALAAGNDVILKPASDAVLVAYELCRCFWRAGVPPQALQLLPCSGATVGVRLVTHPDVDLAILTGGTDTALEILAKKPGLDLLAETGGKNATIVTALSDREQAIEHVLHSAFGHSGQKCSATSLLVLEAEVYDDPGFKRMLCDAVQSLEVGSAWNRRTRVGPLIRPPEGVLETALKELELGESWAVMPKRIGDNPCLYSPGVKWDVQPGSPTHMTELFGPVLGVMKAKDLEEAIALVNQTGYGLTSGLESLDDREQELWLERVEAGNLYINRVTTGAIVLRQPFGGIGKSAFGPGIKAGGPNYVVQLMDFEPVDAPAVGRPPEDPQLRDLHDRLLGLAGAPDGLSRAEAAPVAAAIASYDLALRTEFSRVHDHFRLVGQDNLRRYRPLRALRIRTHPDDGVFDLVARVAAAKAVGCRITVSSPPGTTVRGRGLLETLAAPWEDAVVFADETDAELARAIRDRETDRIRYAARDRAPAEILAAAHRAGIFVARAPVLAHGRIELLWYLSEQSISRDYHRYGNLGQRAAEERAEVR
jgi:RHH-type proline utilization regulon transcriptional repressor/proline dehydrogenase/delta 1-pyrroline-5-carboxylate dehydrogenase